eukprot:8920_1
MITRIMSATAGNEGTELAKQLEIQSMQMKPTVDEKEKDTNDESSNNLEIKLGDPLKGVKDKYTYNVLRYTPYLIFSVAHYGAVQGHMVLDVSVVRANEDTLRALVLVYLFAMLAVCVAFSHRVLKKSRANEQSWKYTLNRMLKLPKPTTIFELSYSEEVPLGMFVIFVWSCIANLISIIFFKDAFYYRCHHRHRDSPCFDDFAVISFSSVLFIAAAFSIFGLLQNIECKGIIQEEKKQIEAKYPNVPAIVQRIDQRLKEWENSTKPSKRRFEIVVTCILLSAFVIYRMTINRQNIWQGGYPAHVVFVGFVHILCDSAILCVAACSCQTVFFHHYRFFWCIMDELSAPINANSVRDIVGWWELRKYYIYCVVDIHSPIFRTIMVGASIGSIVDVAVFFFGWFRAYLAVLNIVYCVNLVFVLTTQGLAYYKAQLSHLSTINQERLRFDMKEWIGDAQTRDMRLANQIIDRIVIDIEKNSHPISVLGVGLDINFMLFLRASTVTLAIALAIQTF